MKKFFFVTEKTLQHEKSNEMFFKWFDHFDEFVVLFRADGGKLILLIRIWKSNNNGLNF